MVENKVVKTTSQRKFTKYKLSYITRQISDYIISKDLIIALLVAAVIIGVGVFLGAENNKVIPINPAPIAHYTQEPNKHISFMSDWDGPDYLKIAQHGYTDSSETNFFPLYPILINFVKIIVRSFLYSALLISWSCLVGAIYYYLKIAKHIYKIGTGLEALRVVAFFVLFPTGVFLIATYTESLFALLALAAIYYAFKNKYLVASLLCLLATATHINGLFVLILVTLILVEQKINLQNILVTLIIGCLGLVSYMVFLQRKFNNAVAFVSAQKQHGWLSWSLSNYTKSIGWLNLVFLVLIVISIIYWWSRRKSFAIYSFLFIVIPLLGGQFGGFNRYVLMDFPLQLMFYDRFRNKAISYQICFGLSVILWSYFLFQYTGGYVGG